MEAKVDTLAESVPEMRSTLRSLVQDIQEIRTEVRKSDDRLRSLPQNWIAFLLGLVGLITAIFTLWGGGKITP